MKYILFINIYIRIKIYKFYTFNRIKLKKYFYKIEIKINTTLKYK